MVSPAPAFAHGMETAMSVSTLSFQVTAKALALLVLNADTPVLPDAVFKSFLQELNTAAKAIKKQIIAI